MLKFPTHALTVSALAAACALLPLRALSQTQTSFSDHTIYTDSGPMSIAAHGDFNNDGREDLIVTEAQGAYASAEYLFLSNGDGTYDAPIKLSSVPGSHYVVGDFNHDGNLDFADVDYNNNAVEIWQGHGDGTFTGGYTIGTDYHPVALVAADLNHDNCTDLVSIASPGTQSRTMQVWLAQCSSSVTFNAGQHITSGVLSSVQYAYMGDFDGDGKADVALSNVGTLQVWYGDGKGNLGSPTQASDPTATPSALPSVGDVDNNGTSDILLDSGAQIGIFKGNTNRTITFQALNTPSGQCPMYIQTADINGDGLNDLVYEEAPCNTAGASTTVVADLATAKGVFSSTEQTIRSNPYWTTGFGIVKSTQGTRPDLAVFPNTQPSQTGSFPPDSLVLMQNTTSSSFPACGTTSQAEGINLCMPTGSTASSPVKFSVSASGPTAMRTVAVWVDGRKLSEQLTHAFSNYSFLDQSVSLSSGSHSVTIYGTGWDNTLQVRKFTLDVGSGSGSGCGAPSSAGINVCKPVSGSTVSSPVEVQATATITGTLARMEIWVDGVKKFTETTSTSFDTSVALANGYHRFDIYAVNTAGAKWEKTVYATVGTASSCAAPSSYGLNVCSPVNNSTDNSPVQATATANISGSLARMEVWVDGVKKFTETTSTSFSTSIPLGSGKHRFDFYAVNTAGTKWETTVYATVP